MFTSGEREALIALGLPVQGGEAENLIDERFSAYKAVTTPSEQLVLTYAAGGRGGGGHEPVGGGALAAGGGAGGIVFHRPGPRPLLFQPEPFDRLFAGGKAAGRGRAPDARVSFRDGQCLERAAPETPPCRRPGGGDAGVGPGVGSPLRAGQRRAGGTADAAVALPGGAVFQLPLCLLLPLRPRHPDAGEGRAEPPGPGEHPPLPLPPGAGNRGVHRPAAGGGPQADHTDPCRVPRHRPRRRGGEERQIPLLLPPVTGGRGRNPPRPPAGAGAVGLPGGGGGGADRPRGRGAAADGAGPVLHRPGRAARSTG